MNKINTYSVFRVKYEPFIPYDKRKPISAFKKVSDIENHFSQQPAKK